MSTDEKARTQIGVLLQDAMSKEGVTLHGLAKELRMTSEYIRRIRCCGSLPSKIFLKILADRFRWDYDEVEEKLVQDRFRIKNGPHGAIAQKFNPEVEPFEKRWHLLEQPQKEMLLSQFDLFIFQNQRHTRGGLKAQA